MFDADSKSELGFLLHALVFAQFEIRDSYKNESMHTNIAIRN